jgi:hypothetical protein
MRFIELTSVDTGRTILVSVESIVAVTDYINDDKPDDGYTTVSVSNGNDLHVHDAKERIIRLIKDSELQERRDQSKALSSISEALSK